MLLFTYPTIQIRYSGTGGIYLFSYTDLGRTKWYSIYYITYMLVIYIIVCSVLIILNILIIRDLQKNVANRSEPGVQRSVSKNLRITRIIILTSSYYILIRIFHLVSLAIFKVDTISGVFYSPSTNLIREFAYLFLVVSYAGNIFVYAYFDKNIKDKTKKYFSKENLV